MIYRKGLIKMEQDKEIDYKAAYEREKIKSADLAQKVATLEDKNQELDSKLNRIKNGSAFIE